MYSYAGTYAANCTYDYSEPQVYQTPVLNKYISRGKTKHYLIEVAPWGHHYDTETIGVSGSQYDEISIGKTVSIDLKEGLFGIQWYYMEKAHHAE